MDQSEIRAKRSGPLDWEFLCDYMITTKLRFKELCETENTTMQWVTLTGQQAFMPQSIGLQRHTDMFGFYVGRDHFNIDLDFTANTLTFLSPVFSHFHLTSV